MYLIVPIVLIQMLSNVSAGYNTPTSSTKKNCKFLLCAPSSRKGLSSVETANKTPTIKEDSNGKQKGENEFTQQMFQKILDECSITSPGEHKTTATKMMHSESQKEIIAEFIKLFNERD